MEYAQFPARSLLVVGQARPAKEDAITLTHGEFYLALVLDGGTGRILDAECNTILGLPRVFVRQLLVGRTLPQDLPELEGEIRRRYFALTQRPLIACLRDASGRYEEALRRQAPCR